MKITGEILERVQRVQDYHQSSKFIDGSPNPPSDPQNRPDPNRIFDGFPAVALPRNVVGSSVPAISLLRGGLDALPDSQKTPKQNLETLASWLYFSNGETGRADSTGHHHCRTCPSESDLFPCEIYVAALAIEGLDPGLYHFSSKEFSLRKLRDGWETLMQLKRGRPDLEFLKTAPAVILISTIFSRSTWKYRKRGYRHCLIDAGHLTQNISAAATMAGIVTLTRMRLNNQTARELIGIAPSAGFADAEVVQGMVIWADQAVNPLKAPTDAPALTPPMETLPRPALAHDVVGFGSILAVHEDCVAPGMAMREVRPPLTELSPLAKTFAIVDLPAPAPEDGGATLSHLLLKNVPVKDFHRSAMTRDDLWRINRLAFCSGTSFPLFPQGSYVGLVRPIWIIHDVTGMDAGVWYFHPQRDGWSFVSRGQRRTEAKYLAMQDAAFGNASAVCLMMANLNRTLREGGPDLYRLAHLEAGSAAQRFYLAAGGLGIACKFTLGFYDNEIRRFLGFEKTGWEPVYAAAIAPGVVG